MKKILCFLLLAGVMPCFAQDVSKMNPSGQSGANEKSRYVLGLVRNGYADRLNKYFANEPWQIQTEIDTYTDADKTSSVGIFCVAVELGDLEVVKSFVENGIGPADLCRVQTFTTKKVVLSRDEALINTDTTDTKTSSTNSGRIKTWFGKVYAKSSYYNSTDTDTTTTNRMEKYTTINYGEKKVIKTYFANPLDFATGEVFDYLWEKGFRSPNLFTGQALADAKANGRTELIEYILSGYGMLKNNAVYVSENNYRKLIETAKNDHNSLAFVLLEKNILGKINSSAQAKAVQKELLREMKSGLTAGNDTTGFGAVNKTLEKIKKEKLAAEAENRAIIKIGRYSSFPIYKYGNYYYKQQRRERHDGIGENEYYLIRYTLDGEINCEYISSEDSIYDKVLKNGRLINKW